MDIYLYIVVPILVIFIGILIHDPLFLGQYTDYLALYSRSPDRVLHGYPYVDYEFEYTPAIASLWLIASKMALFLSAYGYDPYLSMLRSLYAINSVFYIAYVYLVYRFSREHNVPKILSILSIASPSIIYYLFYNWDIIAAFLMILGILFFIRNKHHLSSLSLGLGAAVKVMPVFAMISIFIALIVRDARKALAFLLIGVSAAAAPFLMLLLIYPPGFFYFLNYHSQWYCENCFYILLVDDIYDHGFRVASTYLMLAAPAIYTIATILSNRGAFEAVSARTALLSVALALSFSYVYSPQMNIFLAPLYLLLNNKSKHLLLAQDMLNTMIMILWFHEKALSSILGVESRGPWFRESPIQWIAFSRVALIWVLMLMIR